MFRSTRQRTLAAFCLFALTGWRALAFEAEQPIDVFPGGDIQEAIGRAAHAISNKLVRVHAGMYFPKRKGQAFLSLNRQHDGVVLEAVGEVILTARNPALADRTAESFPAIVNHIVYFGDGISRATVFRGFKLTGANNFVTDGPTAEAIEPNLSFFDQIGGGPYGRLFFFTDGGAIKVFGRSYPVLEGLEIYDNFSSPCGAGVSVEHRGYIGSSVLFTNCIFRNNRCSATGSAVDLLPGSSAVINNCLFVGNISNTETNYRAVHGNIAWPEVPRLMTTTFRYKPDHGSGALTVFTGSVADVNRCTFTGNFNGIDDQGFESTYRNSIFWNNNAKGGLRPAGRYELNIAHGTVENCFIHGDRNDLRGNIRADRNQLDCPDPFFEPNYAPKNPLFKNAGYSPLSR
jgi:hypothetical protein